MIRFIIHAALVFVVFGAYAYMMYNQSIKQSAWFYPMGITLSIMATMLWLGFVKHIDVKQQIVMYNLIWNVVVILALYSIPIVLYKIHLTPISWIGLVMSIGGMIVFRIGSLGG